MSILLWWRQPPPDVFMGGRQPLAPRTLPPSTLVLPGPTTFSPLTPSQRAAAFVLSNGNLTGNDTTSLSGWVCSRCTDFKTSGKWYFEFTVTANAATFGTNGAVACGLGNPSSTLGAAPGSDVNGLCYYPWSGLTFIHGSAGGIQADVTANHVGQCAVNLDTKAVWWKIHTSNWNNNAANNPATAVGGLSFSTVQGPLTPYAGLLQNGSLTMNFGRSVFAFTPPAGFLPWSPFDPNLSPPISMLPQFTTILSSWQPPAPQPWVPSPVPPPSVDRPPFVGLSQPQLETILASWQPSVPPGQMPWPVPPAPPPAPSSGAAEYQYFARHRLRR